VEVAYVGDRKTYQVMLTMRKQGDKLIFDNAGTADQVGAINTTYSGWRGSLMTAINELLCWDQLYAIGGALRHIEFQPALGCFTSATHPASVSTAPVQAMEISLYPAYNTISKMLSCDPELKRDVMTIGGTSQFPLTVFRGIDQWGEKFGYLLLDPMVGAIGAFSFRDGIATGGQVRSPICRIGNVEHNEQSFPLLIIHRKENTDSGGAGKYRGGNGCEGAIVPHKTESIALGTITGEVAVPGPGLFGGYPTSTNSYVQVKGAKVKERAGESGRMPSSLGELEGEHDLVPAKSFDRAPTPDDVWVFAWSGAGGYGDPVERDPELVREDVAAGRVSRDWAEQAYGVVLADDGSVDASATDAARERVVAERLAEGSRWEGDADGADGDGPAPPDGRLTEYLRIEAGEIKCGDVSLGPATRNYKLGALIRDLPIGQANPHIPDPEVHTDHDVKFRQVICPETGQLIQTEICVDGDAPQWDVRPGQG
jgi:N-methylhydantoinase B